MLINEILYKINLKIQQINLIFGGEYTSNKQDYVNIEYCYLSLFKKNNTYFHFYYITKKLKWPGLVTLR